jgi:hypothetical protein
MNLLKITIIILLSLASPALAAETLLKGPDIFVILNDHVLTTTQNGEPADQIFQKNGATFYNAGGSQSQGSWKVEGDQYCSVWPPNPTWACYDVARDGDRVTFISKSGKRTEMFVSK